MANVLGELFQDIADAIRGKTGDTATMKPAEFPDKIAAIETGGGGAEITEFLANTTGTNQYLETFGAFCMIAIIDKATFDKWYANTKPVKVVYDNVEYTLTPQEVMGSKAVGNLTGFGGTGNGEEFAIVAFSEENGDGSIDYYFIIGSTVDTAPTEHTVRIYQEVSSGGSMEGVYTVTFMTDDGSEVLYERLVVDGDDCANVVDRGLLDAPTKESTAQYEYTYSGWSLTSGGAADANALKSVTADRTVYAAFTREVRYYTITYYDGDTVLKTESLPYGSMPNYIPRKEGVSFTGWTPALATVTGNASYTAVWQEKVTFAGSTWAQISEVVTSGNAATTFNVGDERIETLTYSDGTTEDIVLQIAKLDGTASNEKNGNSYMILITKGVLAKPHAYHSTTNGGTMKKYQNTDKLKPYINNTVIPALSPELQAVAKEVDITGYASLGYESLAYYTKCAIPTAREVGFKESTTATLPTESTINMLPIFSTQASKVKKTSDGTARPWWFSGQCESISNAGDWQSIISDTGAAGVAGGRGANAYICLELFV